MLANGYEEATVAGAFDPTALELIVLPTEKCNFRCTYCYEDFAIGAMKPSVVSALKGFIDNRVQTLKTLSLSWFGGEPLLAKRVVLDVGKHAYDQCRKLGVHMRGGLTTNGYLLSESTFLELHSIDHRYFQVTLDGTGKTHDLTRRRADGKGTFDQIWGNLVAIKSLDLEFLITLRVHVGPSNLDDLPTLIDMINDTFGGDERFDVHFHRISNLGGPNSDGIRVLSMKEYEERLWPLKKQLRLGSNSELELVAAKGICYAAKLNSLLIRADGTLGKCTVALNDPRNNVGRLFPDGTIEVNNENLRKWLNGYRDFNEQALGCPLSNLSERTGPDSGKKSGHIESKLVAA